MTVIIFIAVLLLLIIGHELGHFFAAKLARMKVLEFGIGLPPKIAGRRFKEEGTEYTLNWLPFGGFVRIFGEDPKDTEEEGAFTRKHPFVQALVLFAGPAANVILGFLLLTLAFTVGAQTLVDRKDTTQRVSNPHVLVGEVLPGSPAEKSGILPGDEIRSVRTSLGEATVAQPEDINRIINDSQDEVVTVAILRHGDTKTIPVAPVRGLIREHPEERALGVATGLVGTVSYPLHIAVVRAFTETAKSFVFILVAIVKLIFGALTLSADLSQVAGPVGIASLTGEAAAFGLGSLLSFAALLSINLSIVNLLPFPALDGGRLLFLGIEAVTRRKIPPRVAGAVNTLGFAALILLMLAVTVGDISRLVG